MIPRITSKRVCLKKTVKTILLRQMLQERQLRLIKGIKLMQSGAFKQHVSRKFYSGHQT
jgi:hypothetical protein